MASQAIRIPSIITTGLLVVSAIFPTLSLLSIYLRWLARSRVKNAWRSDDWLIVITWIITFSISIDVWAFTPHIGISYIKPPFLDRNLHSAKCILILTLLMQAALATVKISVLLFYKRIFVTPKFTIAAWIAIAIVGAWGIITVVLQLIVSKPVSSSWTGFGTFRFNPVALSEARAGSSLVLDVAILLYPLKKIFNLHISPQRKISVALIFALGGFCCIAAAVRLALVVKTIAAGSSTKANGYTGISRTSQTLIWCIIEPNCSIIAASLPCYGPLVRGRAPESIIRSIRSVLSLRSNGSNKSNRSQRTNGSKPYGQALENPMNKKAKGITESEIELNDLTMSGQSFAESVRDWEGVGGGQNVSHVGANPHDATSPCDLSIEVTKSYLTTAHHIA